MIQDRRQFIKNGLTGLALMGTSPLSFSQLRALSYTDSESKPWIELSKAAYLHNTTPKDFAQEQISRFNKITRQLNQKGIPIGIKHLAPSSSLLSLSDSHQEVVRPGILLHGSFPSANMAEAQQYPLQVSYHLKAPIMVRNSWYDQINKWLSEKAPKAEIVDISSHAMFWEKPEKFNRLLIDFLNK